MGNLGGITQRGPELIDGQIDGVVEVTETLLRPDEVMEFFTCHDLAGMLKESAEDLERLVLEFQADAGLP